MKNFRQEGDAIYTVATAAITSGDFVVVNTRIYGVAGKSAAIGEVVVLANKGVFNLPKKTPQAWTEGDSIYWDAGAKKASNVTGTGYTKIGVATAMPPLYSAAAASADTTGDVRLNPALG